MIFRFSGVITVVLGGAALLVAQRFTDPDTLAPAYPTPQTVVESMLKMADVRAGETVYDLGCGDGRIVITAARQFHAKGVGIEIRGDIAHTTQGKVASLGLADHVRIIQGDALKADLKDADVVTLYLLTTSNEKLRPLLEKQLKPTARVVSHDFEIKGWNPVYQEKMMVDGRAHMIYLYRMDSLHQ